MNIFSSSKNAKRILICAAQVPFVRGGAEYLVDGLRDALRERGHTVDVVSIPFAWHPPERIAEHVLAWRLLDITQVHETPVDQVICTKFPSYMVRHPRKVVWLVHQLRQMYDWYGTPMSDVFNTPKDRTIRESVFRMDRFGLGEAQAVYTISRNVGKRLHHYNRLPSTPLYPPSRYAAQVYAAGYSDYIFTCSRLDEAKRLDLLLRALAHTSDKVRVIIAGVGDALAKLERLAATLRLGERVQFAGFVDDAALVDLYANARAVYYAPIDEDYGFTTVEAFGAARPVVTTSDAGGVLEFVTDGVNGYVVEPEPMAIAARLEQLMGDAVLAARLGLAGQPQVREITWDRVVDALVL